MTPSLDTLKFAEWMGEHAKRVDTDKWQCDVDQMEKVYYTAEMYGIYESQKPKNLKIKDVLLNYQERIREAVITTGSYQPRDVLACFEEKLESTVEYYMIQNFLNYIVENHLGFGSATYLSRVDEYIETLG